MEQEVTALTSMRVIRLKSFLLFFFFLLLFQTAIASGYNVRPSQNDQPGVSVAGELVIEAEVKPIPYWEFLILLSFSRLAAAPETFFSIRLLLVLGGYKRISHTNILESLNRSTLYNFIKSYPGTYFSRIVKETGLNKGTVRYHLRMMEDQEIIKSYRTKGRNLYFMNQSAYTEKEKVVIAALKNNALKSILIEIINNQHITHKALVEKLGVSSPTISWHIRYLKEQDIIKADKMGRYRTYSINSDSVDLLQKYISITSPD